MSASSVESQLIRFKPDANFSPKKRAGNNEVLADSVSGQIIAAGVSDWIDSELYEAQVEPTTIEGGLLLPSFTDAHDHLFADAVSRVLKDLNVAGAHDKAELLSMVETAHNQKVLNGDSPFLIVRGWNNTSIPLTRFDIDTIANRIPVAVLDPSNHGGVVNTNVMQLVEESLANTSSQPSGNIDTSGRATEGHLSVIKEIAAASAPDEELVDAIERVLLERISQGTTAVHDMGIRNSHELQILMTARKKWETKYQVPFPVKRTYLYPNLLSPDPSEEIRASLELRIISEADLSWIGIKLYADGSFGARSAQLSTDYNDDPGNKGLATIDTESMLSILEKGARLGVSEIAVHAIGDAAIQKTILVAEKWKNIAEQYGVDPTNFRIEHFELPLPEKETLAQVQKLGLWIGPQPNFLTDYYYQDRLGSRVAQINPHHDFHEKRLNMMFGTDRMPASPLFAIWCAMQALYANQQLSFEEALHYFTQTPAQFERDNRGQIAVGKKADLVLVDKTLPQMMAGESDLLRRRLNGQACQEEQSELQARLQGSIQNVYLNGKRMYTRSKS